VPHHLDEYLPDPDGAVDPEPTVHTGLTAGHLRPALSPAPALAPAP
jgi:hypothetical protein